MSTPKTGTAPFCEKGMLVIEDASFLRREGHEDVLLEEAHAPTTGPMYDLSRVCAAR